LLVFQVIQAVIPVERESFYLLLSAWTGHRGWSVFEHIKFVWVWHRCKNQNGKNMQCIFWKRKLVTSIPTSPTCRPWPPFHHIPVSAMFPCHRLIPVIASPTVCFPL